MIRGCFALIAASTMFSCAKVQPSIPSSPAASAQYYVAEMREAYRRMISYGDSGFVRSVISSGDALHWSDVHFTTRYQDRRHLTFSYAETTGERLTNIDGETVSGEQIDDLRGRLEGRAGTSLRSSVFVPLQLLGDDLWEHCVSRAADLGEETVGGVACERIAMCGAGGFTFLLLIGREDHLLHALEERVRFRGSRGEMLLSWDSIEYQQITHSP
jgi:hypothetical protein